MIAFPNAKINLGLFITGKRPDGYHDLQTVFLPVGTTAGTPEWPWPFTDILEIVAAGEDRFEFAGRRIDCPLEKNLVYKAVQVFREATGHASPVYCRLEKHLPDGAGMGGGSADAAFALRLMNDICGEPLTASELRRLALRLGADCPVFIDNRPAYAEGVGELQEPVEVDLSGKFLLVVKPDLGISTREAFANVRPRRRDVDLRQVMSLPVREWKELVTNDFEESLFPAHPELARLKEQLYGHGAEFALLTGSGSALYGIYPDEQSARTAQDLMGACVPYSVVLPL